MKDDRMNKEKRLPKAFISAGGSIVVLATIVVIFYMIYDGRTFNTVTIVNGSGLDVRFEEVIVDHDIMWGGPDIIKTKSHMATPWLSTANDRVIVDFRASKKVVELTLVTLNELEETEVVSCLLHIRSDGCHFRASYVEGRLICGACDKDDILD